MNVLAADIGGTWTRFAIIEVQGRKLKIQFEKSYPSKKYACLDAALRDFVESCPAWVDAACFGVAGPVLNGRCKLTNLPWLVDCDAIKAAFGLKRVFLINDLVANAFGIRALSEQDFHVLNAGAANPCGNACLIAPGTGLGEAGLFWDGREHRPFASEGGHCDFAANAQIDYRLHQFLKNGYAHVSWERVLSGAGIVNLFEFLCHDASRQPPEWFLHEKEQGDPAAAISLRAAGHVEPLCVESMRMFVSYLGAEAGNMALKTMATTGVYLAGAIVTKNLEWLKEPGFLDSFFAKGAMQTLMRDMPVRVILNNQATLLGAAMWASNALDSLE